MAEGLTLEKAVNRVLVAWFEEDLVAMMNMTPAIKDIEEVLACGES